MEHLISIFRTWTVLRGQKARAHIASSTENIPYRVCAGIQAETPKYDHGKGLNTNALLRLAHAHNTEPR
jgi:hypothetical protein